MPAIINLQQCIEGFNGDVHEVAVCVNEAVTFGGLDQSHGPDCERTMTEFCDALLECKTPEEFDEVFSHLVAYAEEAGIWVGNFNGAPNAKRLKKMRRNNRRIIRSRKAVDINALQELISNFETAFDQGGEEGTYHWAIGSAQYEIDELGLDDGQFTLLNTAVENGAKALKAVESSANKILSILEDISKESGSEGGEIDDEEYDDEN
jgi:hypothetical protein